MMAVSAQYLFRDRQKEDSLLRQVSILRINVSSETPKNSFATLSGVTRKCPAGWFRTAVDPKGVISHQTKLLVSQRLIQPQLYQIAKLLEVAGNQTLNRHVRG